MAVPIAAILAAVTKSTGAGMKGAGEYLQGKSPSSSNNDSSNNSILDKIAAKSAAKGGAADSVGSGMSHTAGATGAGAAGAAGSAAGAGASAGAGAAAAVPPPSDERLKRICGDNTDLIDLFSKIGSYEFHYNDKAKSLYPNGKNHVDDKRHVGVMAQELEKNPATNAVINTEKNGYKTVDTAQLTLTNTAVLADVCRRLEALEQSMEKQLGI